MSLSSLLLAENPSEPIWELDWRSLGAAHPALLGWTSDTPHLDAGPPHEVKALLSRACCRVATVAFLSSEVPTSAGPDWRQETAGSVCRPRFPGLIRRRDFPFLATREASAVMRLFDDGSFPWTLRAQLLLLSSPTAPLPALTGRLIQDLFERPMRTTADELWSTGVTGLLLPGVDGEVVGLYSTDALWPVLLDSLRATCTEFQAAFERVAEAELKKRLAS